MFSSNGVGWISFNERWCSLVMGLDGFHSMRDSALFFGWISPELKLKGTDLSFI